MDFHLVPPSPLFAAFETYIASFKKKKKSWHDAYVLLL
jgi:hypothetical protein